jgi:hypothetical protein
MKYLLFILTFFAFIPFGQSQQLTYETCLKRVEAMSLLITSYHWYEESGFAIAEGEVKNVTVQKLDDVIAHVSFYTADNQLVTSSEALLDFTTLMPQQSSTFKVYADINPLMQTAVVKFKTMWGDEIIGMWHEATDCNKLL